jgi:hypothetical protein
VKKNGLHTAAAAFVQSSRRVRAYTMETARGSEQCGEDTTMTTPCTTDGRNAVTPPAALPAPGILEDGNIVHPSLVGTSQRIPMRTIGEHEQDTPHILQSHVSSKEYPCICYTISVQVMISPNTHVLVIQSVQFMKS